jgi:hypothetical protein
MKTNQDSITIGFNIRTEGKEIKQIKRFLKNEKAMKIVYLKTSRNKLIITEWR